MFPQHRNTHCTSVTLRSYREQSSARLRKLTGQCVQEAERGLLTSAFFTSPQTQTHTTTPKPDPLPTMHTYLLTVTFGLCASAVLTVTASQCYGDYVKCPAGLDCCKGNQDSGICYNKTEKACAHCYYVGVICDLDKPHCCVSNSDPRGQTSCYGEGEQCCADSGTVAPKEGIYCAGKCGTTTDPNLHCCAKDVPLYDNRTHCCGGGKTCDLEFERCSDCGCAPKNDTQHLCCGGNMYNNATEQCCNGKTVCNNGETCSACGCLKRPDIEECCGAGVYVPSAGETCCKAENQANKVCNSTQECHVYANADGYWNTCCDKGLEICSAHQDQGKCYNATENSCCVGQLCAPDAGCCGQGDDQTWTCFDKTTKQCCSTQFQHSVCDIGAKCCSNKCC